MPTSSPPPSDPSLSGPASADLSSPPSLEEKQIAAVGAKMMALETQIAEIKDKEEAMRKKLKNPDAASTVQKHIALLHTYNEMRDIGTGLMGIIADNRGVRVRDVYRDFGVGESD